MTPTTRPPGLGRGALAHLRSALFAGWMFASAVVLGVLFLPMMLAPPRAAMWPIRIWARGLWWPAAGFAVVTIVGSLLLPRFESQLGVNSSLRDVARFLQAHAARHADFDHYWAGSEFYLGEDTTRFVTLHNRQQERATDPGLYPRLFIEPDAWLDLTLGEVRAPGERLQERWLVRFSRQKGTPFEALFETIKRSGDRARIIRIGDFELLRTNASAAAAGKPASMSEIKGTP